MTMTRLAFADYGSFEHVECGKQSRGPVPLIVGVWRPGKPGKRGRRFFGNAGGGDLLPCCV